LASEKQSRSVDEVLLELRGDLGVTLLWSFGHHLLSLS